MFMPFMISAEYCYRRLYSYLYNCYSHYSYLYKIKYSFRCTFQYNSCTLLYSLPYMFQCRSCCMSLYNLFHMSNYSLPRSRSGWRVVLRALLNH